MLHAARKLPTINKQRKRIIRNLQTQQAEMHAGQRASLLVDVAPPRSRLTRAVKADAEANDQPDDPLRGKIHQQNTWAHLRGAPVALTDHAHDQLACLNRFNLEGRFSSLLHTRRYQPAEAGVDIFSASKLVHVKTNQDIPPNPLVAVLTFQQPMIQHVLDTLFPGWLTHKPQRAGSLVKMHQPCWPPGVLMMILPWKEGAKSFETCGDAFFAGLRGYRSGWHCDPLASLVICAAGSKTVYITSPESMDNMMNGNNPLFNTDLRSHCRVTTREPNHNDLKMIRVYTISVGGSVLIPKGWFHQVVSSPLSISLSVDVTRDGNYGP
jgi:hypothetical protein